MPNDAALRQKKTMSSTSCMTSCVLSMKIEPAGHYVIRDSDMATRGCPAPLDRENDIYRKINIAIATQSATLLKPFHNHNEKFCKYFLHGATLQINKCQAAETTQHVLVSARRSKLRPKLLANKTEKEEKLSGWDVTKETAPGEYFRQGCQNTAETPRHRCVNNICTFSIFVFIIACLFCAAPLSV